MIDVTLLNSQKLIALMLDSEHGNVNHWRRLLEIVPDFIPPFPRDDTRPKIVVRCLVNITEPLPAPDVATSRYSYLRRSSTGGFWDLYGDEFYTVEHAFLAALRAPVPPALLTRLSWLDEEDLARVVERRWCEQCGRPRNTFQCAGCRP